MVDQLKIGPMNIYDAKYICLLYDQTIDDICIGFNFLLSN